MRSYSFTVPGEPVPWKRAGRSGRRSFTQKRDAQHRELVRACARNAGIRSPLVGAVRLDVVFYVSGPPTSPSGDRSNLLKLVEDALEGIAYKNDRQIVRGWTRKIGDAEDPRTEIFLEEVHA